MTTTKTGLLYCFFFICCVKVSPSMTSSGDRLRVVQNHLTSDSPSVTPSMPSQSPLTTHVLNTAIGKPAANLCIKLFRLDDQQQALLLNTGRTNADGRLPGLITNDQFIPATYKIRFETGDYFNQTNTEGFYPYAEIVFTIKEVNEHYHIPLLLSPYGYSTYRGS